MMSMMRRMWSTLKRWWAAYQRERTATHALVHMVAMVREEDQIIAGMMHDLTEAYLRVQVHQLGEAEGRANHDRDPD